MYPNQQQGYPQQPGFNPGYGGYPQQQGYPQPGGYPGQQGYPSGYPPQQPGYPTGPSVNLNMGPAQPTGGDSEFWNPAVGPFADKQIRAGFVSKVYSILTFQLGFSAIFIAAFLFNSQTKLYFKQNQQWMLLGTAIFFISFMILACVESARRTTPCNFILLSMVTLGYSITATVISCKHDIDTVMFAFLATAITCFLVAALARSSKFDITNCGTTLCLLGIGHSVIGLILVLILVPTGNAKTASLLMAVSGALLVSLYLMYDLQLIMGGRKCEISAEEYILAAALLYTDIMQMFIYMLEIIGRIKDD